MTTLTNVSLRLPVELVERVSLLAKTTGRSRTFYMQEAIKQHVEDLEDLYLAEQALIEIRAGKSQTIALKDVMKRYGMES